MRAVNIRKLQKRLLEKGVSLFRDEDTVKQEKTRARAAIEAFLASEESVNTHEDVEWFED